MGSKAAAVLLTVVVLAPGVTRAAAQSDFPAHPVRIVVPFAPGGVVDVMARLLSQRLTGDLRQNFYLQNLAGAGGDIGTRNAAAAVNDGYTILITSSSFVVNPSLHAKVPYDPIRDFEPISIAASSPNVLVVNPSVPARNVHELVDAIRANPDKYSFASAGIGTTPHLSGELFRLSAGVMLVHVPFPGAGPALEATVGGYTPLAFSSLPAAVPLVKAGSLRALATTSAKRVDALPEVPTMAEQGFAGQEAETLLFILAPAGTPVEIVNKLSAEIRQIVGRPDVAAQFDALGFTGVGTGPEETSQRIKQEIAKWAKVIKDANLRQTAE